LSIAALRHQKSISGEAAVIHSADSYGEQGAATVPVLMAMAYIGMMQGYGGQRPHSCGYLPKSNSVQWYIWRYDG